MTTSAFLPLKGILDRYWDGSFKEPEHAIAAEELKKWVHTEDLNNEGIGTVVDILSNNHFMNALGNEDLLFTYLNKRVREHKIGEWLAKNYKALYLQLIKGWVHSPALVFFGDKEQKEVTARHFAQEAYQNISHVISEGDGPNTPYEYAVQQLGSKIDHSDYFEKIYLDLGNEIAKMIAVLMIADIVKQIPTS